MHPAGRSTVKRLSKRCSRWKSPPPTDWPLPYYVVAISKKERSLTRAELGFLRELTRLEIPFLIVGLGGAVLQGVPVATHDVDLWFKKLSDPRIAKSIRKFGGAYIEPRPEFMNPPQFAGPDFRFLDIVTSLSGIGSFDKEYKKAVTIEIEGVKLRVLRLEQIIRSKKEADRPKDRAVLPVLKDALAAIKKRGRK